MSRTPVIRFRLYIAGDTPNSALALSNLHDLCRVHLQDRHEIEVVDVFKEPHRAREDKILMTPTLIRIGSSPVRIVGTLSSRPVVLQTLGLNTQAA